MTQTPVKLTLEQYLDYNDGTDNLYELVNGELVLMAEPTGSHEEIIRFLYRQFEREIERFNQRLVVVQGRTGVRTIDLTIRHPDVMVITKEQERAMRFTRAVVETPPPLIVEIVSPGEKNRKRDYVDKVAEYQAINVPEYWIVDPINNNVSVLLLVNSNFQITEFTRSQQIISLTFPELVLTAEQVLSVQ